MINLLRQQMQIEQPCSYVQSLNQAICNARTNYIPAESATSIQNALFMNDRKMYFALYAILQREENVVRPVYSTSYSVIQTVGSG